jgi:chromosome segregation ATPase
VKGKKGKAAANRRDFQDLERRATEGERRAEKAEAEVRELRERLEQTTTGLQRELAAMRRQRDEAAAPAVAALEQQLEVMRHRLQDVMASNVGFKRAHALLQRRAMSELAARGMSMNEVEAWVASFIREAKADLREGYTSVEVIAEAGTDVMSEGPRSLKLGATGEGES